MNAMVIIAILAALGLAAATLVIPVVVQQADAVLLPCDPRNPRTCQEFGLEHKPLHPGPP